MNYTIDKSKKIPAYLQLYYFLRQDIISGSYPCGSKLPSKRTIATETGLSVIPVEHALELLCEEGYLEARQRSGMYVIYTASDFQKNQSIVSSIGQMIRPDITMRNDRQTHADIISDSIAQSDSNAQSDSDVQSDSNVQIESFPFTVLSKTMRRVISDYGERLLVKSPNRGCDDLCIAISTYLGRSRGIYVNPRQIVIGSGAEYLYGLIVQLLGNDCIYALEDPSYEKISRVYRAYGVTCEFLSMDSNGIKTEELSASHASMLHITPFNSYPSGISADASKKQEYIRWAFERGGYIIEDNYESELTVSRKSEDTVFSMSDYSNVIYVNTFSKTIAPSIRIGYMILPKKLVDIFNSKLGFYSCTVPVFEQFVLVELLNSGEYERHINRVRRQRRKLLENKQDKSEKLDSKSQNLKS